MIMLLNFILLIFTFGTVELATFDYTDDVMVPIAELADNSLYTVFTTVVPYVWTDVNTEYSIALSESVLDAHYAEYLRTKDFTPDERYSSTLNTMTLTDLLICVVFMPTWYLGIKYIKKGVKN